MQSKQASNTCTHTHAHTHTHTQRERERERARERERDGDTHRGAMHVDWSKYVLSAQYTPLRAGNRPVAIAALDGEHTGEAV